MAETVNQASSNSVLDKPADGSIPNDGTGTSYNNDHHHLTHMLTILLGVILLDPYLEPFRNALKSRYAKAQKWLNDIDKHEGGLEQFSRVSDAPLQLHIKSPF